MDIYSELSELSGRRLPNLHVNEINTTVVITRTVSWYLKKKTGECIPCRKNEHSKWDGIEDMLLRG